jgi:chromosome segregation ATPase
MHADILDLALGNAEKLYASLRAFRELCAEISDFEEEAKRAKADAQSAHVALTKLRDELALAQSALDKAQRERDETEREMAELRAEHTELTNDINRIRKLVEVA